MDNVEININVLDCWPFNDANATANVLQEFIESQIHNVFWFSSNYCKDEESKLAEYDFRIKKWVAGRFVGEATINSEGTSYKITIKPRFGEKVLFRMLEEIFNIRITTSTSENIASDSWQHYVKRIIAFIWLQKLANANLHGLPKNQISNENKGNIIKGRLEVRKSIIPFQQRNEVISSNRIKQLDTSIAKIIYQAYSILKNDFIKGSINIPESAQDALNQINSVVYSREPLTESDYKNIRYKNIYLSWKPVIDLSWDIIKRKQLSLKQGNAKKGYGFFIDMAEVWEQYLRTILKKNLLKCGWHLRTEKIIAYKNHFFKRELIPDLVFQNQDNIAIWDAKYKRMLGRPMDVDRSDFFQIHTYIQNFLQQKKVKAGGLLYPISVKPNFEHYKSTQLLTEDGVKVSFSIDGIELVEIEEDANEKNSIKTKETEFITRILKSLQSNI